MSDITPGYIFGTAEGVGRLISSKLNRMGNGAVINPSFISSKPSVSAPASGDQLIMLKADGTYARVPATALGGTGGGGDMFKATYDINGNGVVDTCDSLAYSKLTGVPATFTPSTHAPTHLDNGSDPIPVVSTARTGLVPVLPNDSTRFLNGTGTWTAVAGGSTGDTFEYRWDTGTSAADPGSGYVRSNNANPLSASGVYISYYDRAGVFVVDISRLKSGDTFYIYPSGNATQWVRYQLSANPIDHTSWYELAVSVLEPNGFAPLANASVQVAFPVKPAAHASTHLDNGIDPIPVATTARTGAAPKLSGVSSQYLDGTGTFSQVPWTGITGKPATFPPDATAMLKSVYDTNADNIVDHAALADTAPWTGISGKPGTFAPSAHASTHNLGGSDAIAPDWTQVQNKPATFPPDSTAMLKATYDTNANGVVDTCDSLAWSKLTGTPTTFPPDSTAMLKSVYDTNGDGISDHAALADSAPWTGISGKPASFTPSAHASTHLDNGADPIPVATTTRTGSLRILSGSATQYLDGSGNWSTPAPGGTVNPGTWTSFSYQANWSENSTAQYRIETNGTFQKVWFKGSIQKAATFTTNLAIILPVGARPSDSRRFTLAGQETNTSPDECLYSCMIDTAGNMNIYPVVRSSFVWQTWSNLQTVWLDGISFEI
jgi:hypothetical protein